MIVNFNNMNIQESIKKIIKEETQNIEERTKLEKSVKYFVDELLENYKLPENFYGVVVDMIDNNETCSITALFKKPFKIDDSERLHKILQKIKKEISNFFGSGFDIRWSTTTVDSYNDSYERYYKPQK